jgi:hypothetical protein
VILKKAPVSLLEKLDRDGVALHERELHACEAFLVDEAFESRYREKPYFFSYLLDRDRAIESIGTRYFCDASLGYISPHSVQERLQEISSIDFESLYKSNLVQRDEYCTLHLNKITEFYKNAVAAGMGIVTVSVP